MIEATLQINKAPQLQVPDAVKRLANEANAKTREWTGRTVTFFKDVGSKLRRNDGRNALNQITTQAQMLNDDNLYVVDTTSENTADAAHDTGNRKQDEEKREKTDWKEKLKNRFKEEGLQRIRELREKGVISLLDDEKFSDLIVRIVDNPESGEIELINGEIRAFPMEMTDLVRRLEIYVYHPEDFNEAAEYFGDRADTWKRETGPNPYDILSDEKSFINSIAYMIDKESQSEGWHVALKAFVDTQNPSFKSQIENEIRELFWFDNPQKRNVLPNRLIPRLALFDTNLAAEVFTNALNNGVRIGSIFIEQDEHSGGFLKMVIGNRDAIYRLPERYQRLCNVLRSHERVSSGFIDSLAGGLLLEDLSIPLTEEVLSRVELLISDRRVLQELSQLQYFAFIQEIIHGDTTQFEALREMFHKADTNTFLALYDQLEVQLRAGLPEKMNATGKADFIAPLGQQITGELLRQRLRHIYRTSLTHTGAGSAAQEYLDKSAGIGHEDSYILRGNNFAAVQKIVGIGCYAQEFVPGIAPVVNLMEGYLNGIRIDNQTPQDAVKEAFTNENFKKYGGSECVLIFRPSAESGPLTGEYRTRFPNGDPQSLTAVGLSTDELSAIVLTQDDPDRIDAIKKKLIIVEKYIPVYDNNRLLVFTPEDFENGLNQKQFQSVETYLENPPIQHLSQEADQHGEGTLLEHTQRVIDGTGRIVQKDERKLQLLRVAASLHDIGKNIEGGVAQADKNVSVAGPLLDQIRGLNLAEKELIVQAIRNDEKIGEVIAGLSLEGLGEAFTTARSTLGKIFSDDGDSLQFGMDLYYADVAGIGKEKAMLKQWQIEEKLIRLGFLKNTSSEN